MSNVTVFNAKRKDDSMNELSFRQEKVMKILEISPPSNSTITFYNANKDPVGTLDLNGMTFTGDADEAAQVFFKSVLELYDNELTKARQTIKDIAEFWVYLPFEVQAILKDHGYE